NYPDQIKWVTLPAESEDRKPPTFAFVLSHRQGRVLRAQLASSTKPLRVHARVEAEYGGEPWQVMVEAFIKGAEIRDQDVVLTALAERVIRYVVEGNTAQLASSPAGGSNTFPKPIYSVLGTRHRYNAAVIPFHNSTDHMTFNEAPIGAPAITFTNWPDNYIHS